MNNIGFAVLLFLMPVLMGMVRGEASEEETRAILEDVLATEYCGTAAEQGFGTTTAIRGLSPVQGRGVVHIEEADWGPILLEMAAEELMRCGEATRGALDTIRTESAILDRGRLPEGGVAVAAVPVGAGRGGEDERGRALHSGVAGRGEKRRVIMARCVHGG